LTKLGTLFGLRTRNDGERNGSFTAAEDQEVSFSQVNGKNKPLAEGFVPAVPTDSTNDGVFHLVPKLGRTSIIQGSVPVATASIEMPMSSDLMYFLLEFISL